MEIGTTPSIRMPKQVATFIYYRLISLIFEIREDDLGEYYHLITLWRATLQEGKLYEENE